MTRERATADSEHAKPKALSRPRGAYERASSRGTAVYGRGHLWIENQDPASRKGATIGWFRRYQAADGQLYAVLLSAYLFLTVLPLLLVYSSYIYSDPDALAKRVERRLGLGGEHLEAARDGPGRLVRPQTLGGWRSRSSTSSSSDSVSAGCCNSHTHALGGSTCARAPSWTRSATSKCWARSQ